MRDVVEKVMITGWRIGAGTPLVAIVLPVTLICEGELVVPVLKDRQV